MAFGNSVNELLLLGIARSYRIDDNIFRIAWRLAEQIENGHSIGGVRLAKRIAIDIDISYVGNTSQSRNFCRISQPVITEIDPLQR